ncbi:hypothetical protein ACJJTC_016770 [Scirpophaga incertulas]
MATRQLTTRHRGGLMGFPLYVFLGEHIALVDFVSVLQRRGLLDRGEYAVVAVDDEIYDPSTAAITHAVSGACPLPKSFCQHGRAPNDKTLRLNDCCHSSSEN